MYKLSLQTLRKIGISASKFITGCVKGGCRSVVMTNDCMTIDRIHVVRCIETVI